MNIRKKSFLIFLIFLIISNYLFFLLYWTLSSFSRYEEKVSRYTESIFLMDDIRIGMENGLRNLLISDTGDSGIGRDEEKWDQLVTLAGDILDGDALENLRENSRIVYRQMGEIRLLTDRGDRAGAEEAYRMNFTGNLNLADWILADLQSLSSELKLYGASLEEKKGSHYRLLKTLSLPVFFLVHIFTLFLFIFSRKKVIGPLEFLEESARLYDGNTHGFNLPPVEEDEIGSLALSVKKMVSIIDSQRQWLARNLENIEDGIISLDGNFRITYMNKRAEEMTGWSYDSAADIPYDDVISLKDEIRIGESEKDSLKTLLYPEEGGAREVEIRWTGIKDDLGTVLTIRDIEPERKRQKELEELRQRMIQRDKLSGIGLLAAGMAHEINNPIGYIQSNMRYFDKTLLRLKRETELFGLEWKMNRMEETFHGKMTGDIEELIRINGDNRTGIEKIEEIVKGINSFSRDKSDSSPAEQDVNDLIRRAVKIVRNKTERKTEFHLELQPVPPTICFPNQIEQVLLNLLINALHAADGDRPEISITTSCSGDMIRCSVEDNGSGIGEEMGSRIFDPFFTTKKQGEGTGLGLYVSYNIIRKHGGEIRVGKSRWGGAEFSFYIPVNRKDAV